MTGYSIEHLELKGRGCEIRRGATRQLQVGYMPIMQRERNLIPCGLLWTWEEVEV